MTFDAQAPDGSAQHIVVTKVEGDNVMIDINHPLAGVALNFDIKGTSKNPCFTRNSMGPLMCPFLKGIWVRGEGGLLSLFPSFPSAASPSVRRLGPSAGW